MTSTADENYLRNRYLTSKIKEFQEVRTVADYIRIASRESQSTTDRNGNSQRFRILSRLRSWPRADRLSLANSGIGALALVVAILALLVLAGLLIL